MGAPGLHCHCGAGERKQWERNEAWRVEKLGTNWVTGRALCGPHWVTGMEGALSPARAAMPNTLANSWGVWGNCGAPVGSIPGGILAASFAPAHGAGSAVLAQQPQEVSAISAKGLENKWGQKMRQLCLQAPGSAHSVFSPQCHRSGRFAREFGVLGLDKSPRGSPVLPGGLGLPMKMAGGWDTASAIVGCPVWGGG